jgi:hypothetical protein
MRFALGGDASLVVGVVTVRVVTKTTENYRDFCEASLKLPTSGGTGFFNCYALWINTIQRF